MDFKTMIFASVFSGVCLAGSCAEEIVPPEALNPPDVVPLARFEQLPPHPRLLADAAKFAVLKEQIVSDKNFARLFALLRRSGDRALASPPVEYVAPPGENLLKPIRDAEHRTLTLAMLYRLTGEARYLDGAKRVLHGLADRPWTHTHYLDDATSCWTLGLGYDWLHDELTPEERESFATKIHRDALAYTRRNIGECSFLWATFNWNQICHSGLVLGALATAEHDPEMAHHIVNRSLALIPRAAAVYAPDGSYPEGPGYWAYGTTYHVLQIEALRSALGESGGLEKFPGFLESAAVLDQLTGPSGRVFNFFDNHAERVYHALDFWFARETRRADLAAAEWDRLLAAADGEAVDGRELALVLLWMDAPKAVPDAPAKPPLHWQAGGHQPVAVLRSAWGDPGATWVAFKGGTPDQSHGHMDVGSFVLEAGGVRWAADPEIEDYLEVRRRSGLTHGQFFSYAQDSARWSFFRLGPEGHNLLRFDGARQTVAGHVELAPIQERADAGASVAADLLPVYAGQVAKVQRQITLRGDGAVEFTDTWTARADHEAKATWQWLTHASVTIEKGGVKLEQDGRRLGLQVGREARIDVQEVDALLDAKLDAKMPGYSRIVLSLTTPPGAEGRFEVVAKLDSARH